MFTESELATARQIVADNERAYEIESELEDEFEERQSSIYWVLHREGTIDLSAHPRWWYDAAQAKADYNMADIVTLLLQTNQNSNIIKRWESHQRFDANIDCFMDHLSGDMQPLVNVLPELIEPLNLQLQFELAKKGALQADQLADNLINVIACHVIKDDDTDMLEFMCQIWPKQKVMETINIAAGSSDVKMYDLDFLAKTVDFITPEQLAKIVFNLYHGSDSSDMHLIMDKNSEGLVELISEMAPTLSKTCRRSGLITALSWVAVQLEKEGKQLDRELAILMLKDASQSDLRGSLRALKAIPKDLAEAFVLSNMHDEGILHYFCTEKIAQKLVDYVVDWGRGECYVEMIGVHTVGKKFPQVLVTALENKKIAQRTILVQGLAKTTDAVAIPTLISYLEDTIIDVRIAAINGLKKQGEAAIDALLTALDSRKKNVRLHASEILMALDEKTKADPRIIDKTTAKVKKEKIAEIKVLLAQLSGVESDASDNGDEKADIQLASVSQQEHDSLIDAIKQWDKWHRQYWRETHDENDIRAYQDFSQLMLKTCGDRAVLIAAKGLSKTDYTSSCQINLLKSLTTVSAKTVVNAHACLTYWCERWLKNSKERDGSYKDRVNSMFNRTLDHLVSVYGDHMVQAIRQVLLDAKLPALDTLWERYLSLNSADAVKVFPAFSSAASVDSQLLAMQAFPEQALPQIIKLLTAKKAGSRTNAAMTLIQMPMASALPALESALAKEKNAKVKAVLANAAFAAAILELELQAKLSPKTPLSAQEQTDIDALLSRFAGPLPKELDLATLPRLVWTSGTPLSDGAMQWAIAKLAEEGAKTQDVLLAAMTAQWQSEQFKPLLQTLSTIYANDKIGRLGWVLFASGLLGDDETMYELGKNLDEEARNGASASAFYKVQIMARHGSTSGLTWLDHWIRKARSQGLKHRAMNALDDVAAARGISRDEIADSVASDLGFNAQGEQAFAFGERNLTLTLKDDGSLALSLEGKQLKSAPATRKDDDAEELKARRAELTLYRKQVKQAFANALARLEQAMVTGRTFSKDIFVDTWGSNALLAHIGRRVVWCLTVNKQPENKQPLYVRLDESNCLVDIDDEPVTWPEGAMLTVLHPLNCSAETCAQWQEIFADYEIESPFPQLARPVFTLPEDEKTLKAVKRYKRTKFPTSRLRTNMERRGWANGEPKDAGSVNWLYKYFASADITVAIHMSNGFCMGFDDYDEDQEIPSIDFLSGRYGRDIPYRAKGLVLSEVDPIVYSETIADLESINQG